MNDRNANCAERIKKHHELHHNVSVDHGADVLENLILFHVYSISLLVG